MASCKTSLVLLYRRNYVIYMAGIHGNYHESSDCFEYPNQATKKILAKNFLTIKIQKSKISNPKKSFDHSCHLKSGVPPWRPPSPCKHALSVIWHNH